MTLYSQELPRVKKEDFIVCLKEEPVAYQRYLQMTETEQKVIIDWIYSAKNDSVKVERIADTLNRLSK